MATPPALPPLPVTASRASVTGSKLVVLGGLTALLCVPLVLTQGLLKGRAARQRQAEQDIQSTWGKPQTLVGPILSVPYRCADQPGGRATAHFLPEELTVEGPLEPSVRKRGIFQAVVYRGDLAISGTFKPPSLDAWKVAPENILWEEAKVSFGISDLRGIHEALRMRVGEHDVELLPGTACSLLPQGLHAAVSAQVGPSEVLPFALSLGFKGSRSLAVAPLGARTQIRLRSTWPDPTFIGAELPADRRVDAKGFDATWRSSFYQRPFPAAWSDAAAPALAASDRLQGSLLGVELLQVMDAYRLTERAVKYGVLFIVLVFTAFFLFEACSPVRVHPLQYLLVGFALCLFFLALLSLSEFLPFGIAYAAGALASAALIVLYSRRALQARRRAGIVAAELAVVYGFLFVVLRLQDYALLTGTAGLFAALAAVMYATRNLNEDAAEQAGSEAGSIQQVEA